MLDLESKAVEGLPIPVRHGQSREEVVDRPEIGGRDVALLGDPDEAVLDLLGFLRGRQVRVGERQPSGDGRPRPADRRLPADDQHVVRIQDDVELICIELDQLVRELGDAPIRRRRHQETRCQLEGPRRGLRVISRPDSRSADSMSAATES